VIIARVTWTGRTSIEIRVRVDREQIDGRRERALEAFTTFVCVDTQGEPQQVPPLDLLTDEHRDCWRRGEERRVRRLQARADGLNR
ncbi:MAG: acyl-CoA thioesterase, partial [Myxococcales bacterium]|nr:acyl-CoA thioesterase [Myxococcales bacterium]